MGVASKRVLELVLVLVLYVGSRVYTNTRLQTSSIDTMYVSILDSGAFQRSSQRERDRSQMYVGGK